MVASGAAGSERVTVTTSIGPTRLVSSTFGYSVVYRTVTHGASAQTEIHLYLFDHHWRDATPSLGRNINTIEDVSFVDPRHGWVAAYDCANVSVYVYRTSDGGRSWRSQGRPGYHSCGGGPSYLTFSDRRHGWLEPVSPNGPVGELLRTADGGRTWRTLANTSPGTPALPCLAPIEFVSASDGWLGRCSAFTPGSARLFRTSDGGRRWTPVRIAAPHHRTPAVFDLPRDRVVAGTVAPPRPAVAFFVSPGQGASWSLRSTRRIDLCPSETDAFDRPVAWPASVASARVWWIASGRTPLVQVTADGGRHWRMVAPHGLPARICTVTSVTAANAQLAWAVARYDAGRSTALYETRDGGRNWRRLSLPPR